MARSVLIMAVTRYTSALFFLFTTTVFLTASTVHGVEKEADPKPNYMPAIRQELARLDLDARCDDGTSSCVFKDSLSKDGPKLDLVLKYSRRTDAIYIYFNSFLILKKETGPSLELAHRLLELNREMVTAKFEWDRSSNTVRLSVVVNTDSNFDRKAFRSQIMGIRAIAKKLWPRLNQLTKP